MARKPSDFNKKIFETLARLEAKLERKPRIKRPKQRLRDSLDAEELRTFRQWLSQRFELGGIKLNWWVALLILRGTGCRVAELRFMTWENVLSLARKGEFILSRSCTKTRKDRLFALSKFVQSELQEFLNREISAGIPTGFELLLPGRGQQPLCRETVTRFVNRLLSEFNLNCLGGAKRLTSHCFRISLVSRFQTVGKPLEVAGKVIGHSNPLHTTVRYSRHQMGSRDIKSHLDDVDKDIYS